MAYEQRIQDNNINLQNSINIIKTFPDKQETIDQNLLNTQKNLIYQIAMALQNKSEALAQEAVPVTGIIPDGWYVFYEDENGILQTYGMDEISLLGDESRDDGYIEITTRKNSIMALYSPQAMEMAEEALYYVDINNYSGAELLYYDYDPSTDPNNIGIAVFKIIEENFNLYTSAGSECCFVAGTKILTSLNGQVKNIEDIKENDQIVSYNILTGENYNAKVKKLIIKKDTTDIAEVFLANGIVLKMNAYHPIYTEKGWHSITNHNGYDTLIIGDKVKTFDNYEEIINIKRYKTNPIITYNIDVINIDENLDDDSNDTFYANGVVVHNSGSCEQW